MLRRVIQQIALFAVLLTVTLAGGSASFVSLNARILLVIVTLLSMFVNVYTLRNHSSPGSWLHWGWLLFAFVTLFSTLNGDFRRSIELWLFPLGLQFPYFFAVVALLHRQWKAQFWLRAILLAGVVLFIQTAILIMLYLWSWRNALPAGVLFPPLPFRLSGVLDNPNVFAAFLALIIPAAVGYGISVRSTERLWIGAWVIVAALCLLATGSRGGLIATSVGVVSTLLLIGISRGERLIGWLRATRVRQTAAAIGLILSVTLIVSIVLFQSIAPSRANAVGRRVTLWQVAIEAVSRQPLFGIGFGQYPIELMSVVSTPPTVIERHAHNLFLNLLAETGIVGFSALMLLIGLLIRTSIRAWQTVPREQRALVSGLIGGLIAYGVVGLTDDPMAQAAPFIIATTFCAVLAAYEPTVTTRSWFPVKAAAAAVSLGVCVLGIVLNLLYVPQWVGAQRVIALRTHNDSWIASAKTLELGIEHDPADALLRLQAAVAWARASYSNGDENALRRAIQRYQEGITLNQDNAVHHLNLGVLFQHIDPAPALIALETAALEAPESAVIHLNYGIVLETSGQFAAATKEYTKVLMLNSRWRLASFWNESATRLNALDAVPILVNSPVSFSITLQIGDTARAAGQTEAALTAYQRALKEAIEPPDELIARGLIAWTKGDLPYAHYYLKAASESDGENVTLAWLYQGDLAASEDDTQMMQNDYQIAFSRLDSYSTFGPGTLGEITYAVNVFGRYGYVTDYLPDVMLLDIGSFEAERFVKLAQLRVTQGDIPEAVHILQRLLRSSPGYLPAKDVLQNLAGDK